MGSRLGWGATLTMALLTVTLHGEARAEGPRWRCWYDGGEGIVCMLASGGGASMSGGTAEGLPAMAREIRVAPGGLAGRRIRIPMFAPPMDDGMDGELARAVMCGADVGCEVVFTRVRPGWGEMSTLEAGGEWVDD